jgi:hypothetical protein
MSKQVDAFRQGKDHVEEIDEGNGKTVVLLNGKEWPGTFHEAIVHLRRAPLIEMRDECRRLAAKAREIRIDAMNDLDCRDLEHEDY